MKLPEVSGKNLLRQKKKFPADFDGAVNLVFVAFQRWHQDHVDTWVPLADKLEQTFPDFAFYEFPTLHRMNPLSRMFLDEGMRAGIPSDDTRGRTITLYLEKDSFRRALDIPDERNIWLFLFDGEGQVLWRTSGPHSQAKAMELEETVSILMSKTVGS